MVNAVMVLATLALSVQSVNELLFPPPPADEITNIIIGGGSNSLEDGAAPGIHLFDFQGKTIGIEKASGDKIEKGVPHTIAVNHRLLNDNAAAQAEYMSVVQGGNDALCISYITATLPSGGVQYTWNGDIGFQCGAPWIYGNTTFSSSSQGMYQPRCNWIDGDNSDGSNTVAMGIHLPSFVTNQDRVDHYNKDNDMMCKSDPRFKLYGKKELSVEDAIPYFKSPVFDLNTLLDFSHDQTLDHTNWDTAPVKISAQGYRKP